MDEVRLTRFRVATEEAAADSEWVVCELDVSPLCHDGAALYRL